MRAEHFVFQMLLPACSAQELGACGCMVEEVTYFLTNHSRLGLQPP